MQNSDGVFARINVGKMKSFMLIVLFSSWVSAQNLNLICSYDYTFVSEYACMLSRITVTDESLNVTFGGNHVSGKSDDDVLVVSISESNTRFMIRQIFQTFPNIIELEIRSSKLQSINIPSTIQLKRLNLYGNNITVIENGRFRGQTQLESISAIGNNIQVLEENAFEGLNRLQSLILLENRIQVLQRRTFHPLTALENLDLFGNAISRIEPEHFALNRNLRTLSLVSNRISTISPNFADNLKSSLTLVDLSGNVCTGGTFTLKTEADWINMNNNLQLCFNNFKSPGGKRRILLDFRGELDILDENGNIITRF